MVDWTQVAVSALAIVPPTIVAWAAWQQGKANAKQVTAVEAKSDTIIEKAVEIHTLTNSNLSMVTHSLDMANEKISGLEKMMNQMTQAKSDTLAARGLTDATAERARNSNVAAANPGNMGDILSAIPATKKVEIAISETADNTKMIAENTAKTDAKVQELQELKGKD